MSDANSLYLLGGALSSDERIERFKTAVTKSWDHFLRLEDMDLVVLKGHLLVEEQLRVMVEDKLINPKEIQRFSFSQYLSLTKAMYELPENTPWLWTSITCLNRLRNTVAHELEPGDLDRRIKELQNVVPRNDELAPEHSVRDCISSIYICCMWFTVINNCG